MVNLIYVIFIVFTLVCISLPVTAVVSGSIYFGWLSLSRTISRQIVFSHI